MVIACSQQQVVTGSKALASVCHCRNKNPSLYFLYTLLLDLSFSWKWEHKFRTYKYAETTEVFECVLPTLVHFFSYTQIYHPYPACKQNEPLLVPLPVCWTVSVCLCRLFSYKISCKVGWTATDLFFGMVMHIQDDY